MDSGANEAFEGKREGGRPAGRHVRLLVPTKHRRGFAAAVAIQVKNAANAVLASATIAAGSNEIQGVMGRLTSVDANRSKTEAEQLRQRV